MQFVLIISLFLCLCEYATSNKECTNTPTKISSHTFHYQLLTSTNESLKNQIFSQKRLANADDLAFASFHPRKYLRGEENDEFSSVMMKNAEGANTNFQGNFLKEFSLHDVRVDPYSKHGQAQQTNLQYLLMFDVDSLVWSFRRTAGFATPGTPYGGWEAPNIELRGHFVGHFLSASAQMWASTHNGTLKQKMSAVVSALFECQTKMGSGYLSAFPTELFDRVEAVVYAWAPYYTIHKIMAGLVDQHVLAGDLHALKMVTWMADYFYDRVHNVITKYSIDRHWRSLNEEFGGMNDVLYQLYLLTQNQKYLLLAHLFDKPCFLGLLAVKAEDLSGFHANTHIPIVIGAQLRYEITGDPLYKEIGLFFMDAVNSSHSFATGGTSYHEFWTEPRRLADTLISENQESCATYNMLKVSRRLFRWTKEMAYADYYERALTNGVLSIQRGTEPGVMIYFLPMARGGSKAISQWGWGGPFNVCWCCYGTAMESFSKLGDSIYFEENNNVPGLYIIQFISSTLNWKAGHMSINLKVQEPVTSWDPHFRVNLTILPYTEQAGGTSTLNLRIPFWTTVNGAKAFLNGRDLSLVNPGSFLSVTRKWSPGDHITLELPINLRIEPISDDRPEYASVHAILYGPYLLAGISGGDWDIRTGANASISDWITPIPSSYNSQLISLTQQAENSTLVLSNSGSSISMHNYPKPGTNESLHATFRLILTDSNSSKFSQPKDVIGKPVMLEPIHLPGKVISLLETDNSLVVSDFSPIQGDCVFRLVVGLDGKPETVSLESESQKGCFVYGGPAGSRMKLSCISSSSYDSVFKHATSFVMETGCSSYETISFVAKGAKRDFLLTPLLSLRDEAYTVYFNIQS